MSTQVFGGTLNVRGDGESPVPVRVTIGDKLFLILAGGLGLAVISILQRGKKR